MVYLREAWVSSLNWGVGISPWFLGNRLGFLTTTDYSAPATEVIDMKRWLMDILACPVSDCRSELELEVFTSHNLEADGEDVEEID